LLETCALCQPLHTGKLHCKGVLIECLSPGALLARCCQLG